VSRRTAAIAATAVAAAAAAALAAALLRRPGALEDARAGAATPGPDGVQAISLEVVRGAYAPNLLRARAGEPLRLRIDVRDRHACATHLVVPDLGLALPLPERGVVEHLLPPAPPGAYVFTCEMKMVKGVIHLE
jgi:plastocyanin domain-containing protein